MTRQSKAMLKTLFGFSAQSPGLSNLLTEASYRGTWCRPGLSIPDRLIRAIAALSTGPRLKAPHRYTSAGEAIIQTAPYTGFLHALGALSAAFA